MDDDAALRAHLDREDRIMRAALGSVQRLERYHPTPANDGGELRLGWLWTLMRRPLPRPLAEAKLRSDIYGQLRTLRARIWTLPDLDDVRAGVLVHVALALGEQRLLNNRDLWAALQAQNYDAAEHVLLRSNWPSVAGDDAHARDRILDLARQMRTGEAT